MYRISVPDTKIKYELSELAKMFMPASGFDIIAEDEDDCGAGTPFDLVIGSQGDKNAKKRALYDFFREKTGKDLDWGILTGVRPGKLYNENSARLGAAAAEELLRTDYKISEPKLELLRKVHQVQAEVLQDSDPKACGIYVGIPFCPTRCVYCSFTSNKITKKAASAYLKALLYEISSVCDIIKRRGLFAESIYIGGGTPTSLDEEDFEVLMKAVSSAFICDKTREFTVEAGRPDTITEKKLELISRYGAGRISINPQSMKQHTLDLIGRSHTPEEIEQAFALAKSKGIRLINADLITGLPEEQPEDFEMSLNKVIDLDPANITVHTLAVKKASRLIEADAEYSYRQAETVRSMLAFGSERLKQAGYVPYYLYRQKHMAGNFENVGYCKPGTASLYNIRIMEENQSIIALGAGAISKMYYPAENRLERIANVSNYEIYIDRIDEMIKRKEDGII